jgi:hypothetical protein
VCFTETYRDSVTRFFALGFFHESPFPKPLKIALGSFRIFSKIRGDIRKSRCTTGVVDTGGKFYTGGKLPPVSTTPAANLPPVSTTPAANFRADISKSRCTTGVNDTSGKFAVGVNEMVVMVYSDAWGKLIHEKKQ